VDPEIVFAQIDAGDPSVMTQLGEEAGDCSRSVDRDARAIVRAASKPSWTGRARAAFEAQGLEAYLSAAMTSLRLVRAGEVLDYLGGFYRDTQHEARQIIEQWRALPDDRPAFIKLIEELTFSAALDDLKSDYEKQLRKAVSEYLHVDAEFREWARQGAILDYVFYLDHDVLPSVRIPDSYLNGVGGGWTPQGLGYAPKSEGFPDGRYLTTSYGADGDQADGKSQITVIDARTGEPGEPVPLRSEPGSGDASPNHAGGTVVDGNRVYVVGGKTLHVYDLAAIQEASRTGQPVQAIRSSPVPASAYVTVSDDGQVYVGEDDTRKLFPVTVNADGRVDYDEGNYVETPESVNGVSIRDGVFTYSVQHGREERGDLVRVDPGRDGDPDSYSEGDVISSDEIANMAQNLTMVGNRLIGLSESGAKQYATPTKGGDPRDLWGTTHLFEVPNAGAGYLVETATLRESMQDLRAAERGLDAELPTIRSFRLPARAVGDVAGAGAFASEVNSYFDDTATRLRHSTDAVDVSAKGLAEVADTYDETDGDSRDRFRSALDGML
jgi:hypothetical protein